MRPMRRTTTPEEAACDGGAGALAAPAPDLPLDEAAEVARTLFGVDGAVSPLDSERDQNVRVDAAGGRFVLKISNAAEERVVVDLQVQALLHAAHVDPELPLPAIRRALDGSAYTAFERGGRTHLVHMLAFLDGDELAPEELDGSALYDFGAFVARVGLALRGFFHPAAERRLLWDVKRATDLRPFLSHIDDAKRRATVRSTLDLFEERVVPFVPRLRAQIVHGDLTLGNVLFDAGRRPAGVIDFGDVIHTALVFDLAVALAALLRGGDDTWDKTEAVVRGYGSVVPLEDGEVAVLAEAVAARLAATVAISAWRVRSFPENVDYITAFDAGSWRTLDLFEELGWDEVRQRFRRAAAPALVRAPAVAHARARAPLDELLERRRRALGPALSPLSYERPLQIARAEGVWMFDAEGRRYLDAYNNVPSVGHSHPRVVDAIATQARLLNTNTRYLHEAALELAERLVASLPHGLDTCLFVNSGSEANDLAWRIATAVTRRDGALVSEWAYHGVTVALDPLSPSEWSASGPSHVATVPPPGAARAADVAASAVEALESRGHGVAAMLLDTAWTSDGIFTDASGYEAEVVRAARAAGGLFVADEVQAGFGRLGTHLWSFERAGVDADFVTLGKPMGNGHPVAALVTRADIATEYARQRPPLFSTFGGNPVSCAAALAVLDVIEEEGLVSRAEDVGAYLRSQLVSLTRDRSALGVVRGAGLLVGVEVVASTGEPDAEAAAAIANGMRGRGVLIGTTGRSANVLKIRPPLQFGRDHADRLVDALAETTKELGA